MPRDRNGLSPLEITTDQKLILGEKQLILTNAVRDYTVEMTVDHVTEVISHGHSVTDTYTGGRHRPAGGPFAPLQGAEILPCAPGAQNGG